MIIKVDQLVSDFLKVAQISGIDVGQDDLQVEFLQAPHTPPKRLPKGHMAVYVFAQDNLCLKVGKVNIKSQARYTYHHYGTKRARSSLALSILRHSNEFGILTPSDENIRNWILTNTSRLNFLLHENKGPLALNLLEAFLQCRLTPRFEGATSK